MEEMSDLSRATLATQLELDDLTYRMMYGVGLREMWICSLCSVLKSQIPWGPKI